MNTVNFRLISLLILLSISVQINAQDESLPHGYPKTDRNKLVLNQGWKFHLGDPDSDFYKNGFNDASWEEVCFPHTLQLTSIHLDGYLDDKTQPTFHRNVGWYRKEIKIGNDPSKKIYLEFEGAHQVTDLWVNGRHVGQHAIGGYTPFIFDISSYAKFGKENQITLLVDNRSREDVPPDPGPFDYIKFSGLYRDVYLVEKNSLHITFNIESMDAGVTITTPSVDPINRNATINIKTELRNESKNTRTARVVNRIVDKEGKVVLKLEQTADIEPGSRYLYNQIGGIEENLHLWSIDDPYLYKVNTLVLENGRPVDCVDNVLGIREFEFHADKGFSLNGESIELIGFNRHQHYAYIGDALPNSLHYKDMLQFKELGFNTVRTAHYPQDNALIEACDELGLLVYEEAPTWINIPQNQLWFDRLEKASRIMVRNHRNHPSIVIWGAGINHRGYVPDIHYAIKQEDPNRLTASQSSFWTGWQTSGLTDIYANMIYRDGLFEQRNEALLAMEGWYGPEVIARYKRDPLLTGIISWTAHAYYTFHDIGNWEDRTRLGVLDAFRYPKESIIWWYPSEMKNDPTVYIDSKWTPDIRSISVYSNCPEVEVFINERFIGRYKPSTELKYQGLDHPPFKIGVNEFEPGNLTVRGMLNGKVMAEASVFTPEEAIAIRLVVDTTGREFVADGADILVAYAEIVDKNGTIIQGSETEVSFSVEGDASIIGDKEGIGSNPVLVKNGVAPVLIRAGRKSSEIKIIAEAVGLKAGVASVKSVNNEIDVLKANAYSIFDLEKVQVDMGAADQLVQFGWKAWNGSDGQPSFIEIEELGGFNVNINPVTDSGILRWLGEMNVIGKFGYVYGEGVLCMDSTGVMIEFEGLPAGNYQLKTYHHAPQSNTNEMDPNLERLMTEVIHKLPYATVLEIDAKDAKGLRIYNNIRVTEGKDFQYDTPGKAIIDFTSDGTNPVQLIFKDQQGKRGVWLNGFELEQLWK